MSRAPATLPELASGELTFRGQILLSALDPGLTQEPDPRGAGLFLAARSARSSTRLVFRAGTAPRLGAFTACHRYEPYWMKPCAGQRLASVPEETQFFLAQLCGGEWLLLVPLIDEPFRFCLRGHPEDRLELLAETGDPHLGGTGGLALFVAAGNDPFRLLEDGAGAVAARLGARLRTDKPVPDFADTFGWCTWDAFYQDVSAAALHQGLEQFRAGGIQPRFVILDDGWQSVRTLPTGERRLGSFAANEKFGGDLRPCIRQAKSALGVETFLVWHAIAGYWGGVDAGALPGYGVIDQPRRFGEGIMAHMPRCNEEWWGGLFGLVAPGDIERFFDDYHRSLAEQGVDGVKVDSQAVLEGLATRQGGRVRLDRAYRAALERSVQRHFGGRLINCMANAQETFYGAKDSTLTRTSIDFFPSRPASHAEHLYTNAQVGLWFGHFMLPDWDMFQSGHEWGAYHAAGRALSGGPVYVSDKPGQHDFALLRKLVCSDGRVLRADAPGLPTLDCLCVDPTRERVPLKIWNRAGPVGLIGAFHALAGAGGEAVSGTVSPSDVPGLAGERFACRAHVADRLEVLEARARKPITLQPRGFEIFSFAPIEHGFAVLGLAGLFNGPAALERVHWESPDRCRIRLRDEGTLVAYSERPPRRISRAGEPARELEFQYAAAGGELKVAVSTAPDRALVIEW